MAVFKTIKVEVWQVNNGSQVRVHLSETSTFEHAPLFVAGIQKLVTGHHATNQDHDWLNGLHTHGRCNFNPEIDSSFSIVGQVTYS